MFSVSFSSIPKERFFFVALACAIIAVLFIVPEQAFAYTPTTNDEWGMGGDKGIWEKVKSFFRSVPGLLVCFLCFLTSLFAFTKSIIMGATLLILSIIGISLPAIVEAFVGLVI
jgi:hypothetical protein